MFSSSHGPRICPGQHSTAKLDLNTWIYISEKGKYSTLYSVCSDGILKQKVNFALSTFSNLSRFHPLLRSLIPSGLLQTIIVPSEFSQCKQPEIMYCHH